MNTSAARTSKTSRKPAGIRRMIIKLSRKFSLIVTWRPRARVSHLLAMMLAAAAGPALALPTGGQVTSGDVNVAQTSDTTMTITQGTNKGIVNWQGYSVYGNETVTYVQPGANSVTLNRVVGGDASEILGQIVANGQIFLINPNGVLFGADAQIDVGGMVASTLDIGDADFLAGRYTFQNAGGAGSVVNQGSLTGHYVALVGPTVINSGSIDANGGTVALAAGDRVSLDISGDGLMQVSVDAAAAGASISHSGAIVADGGKVYITAKSADALMDTVLNVSGVVRARSLSDQNGVIRLDGGDAGVVSVTGALDASGDGGNGGTVVVTGDKVGLFENARIDASGATGGGTVLVGGNYQGQGPERNASMTYVAAGASIDASATGNGDGGTVIVWGNDYMHMHGQILARGGVDGGNGGFIETSSHGDFSVTSAPDAGASHGQAGVWLIDPIDLTINNAADSEVYGGTPFTPSGEPASISWATIDGALGSSDVIVTTVGTTGSGTGAITIAAAGSLTGTNDLTINAADTITVNSGATITMGGEGSSLAMNAANGITINANITTADSNSSGVASGGVALTTTNGDITVNSTITTGQADVNGTGGARTATSGSINLTAGGSGGIYGTGRLVVGNAAINNAAGGNDTATVGSISLNANEVSANGSGHFNVRIGTASGGNTNNQGSLAATTDGIGSDGEIRIASDAALRVGVLNTLDADATNVDIAVTGAALTLVAGSDLDLDNLSLSANGITGSAAALTVGGTTNLVATGFGITLDNAGNDFGGAVSSTGVNVTLVDADDLVLGTSTVTGNLDVTAGGAITQTGALAVTGTTGLSATGFDITLDNAGNSFGGAIASDGANVTLVAAGALDLGTTTATGDLDVTATGNITDSGDLAVTGLASFDAGSNAITLGDDNGDANTNFGSLSASGGAIDIAEDSDMSIANVSGTTVVLGSAGNMIDGGGADPNIAATTSLELNATGAIGEFDPIEVSSSDITATAGGAIKLANTATALTTIDLSAGGTGAIQFAQTGGFGLVVTSATSNDGAVAISNTGADMTVATVTAGNAGAINLTTVTSGNLLDDGDDGTTNLSTTGAITLTVAGTSIGANSGAGTVPADYLDIDIGSASALVVTNGPTSGYFNLVNAGGTVLSSYFAGMLPASAVNLGIGVTGEAFSFDDTTFGTGSLTNLTVYATSITNAGSANVTVSGNAHFGAGTVTLGDQASDTMNFGSLSFTSAGAVNIAEDSATQLAGTSTAGSLTLASTGAITNAASASVTVTNNASFSGTAVSLGGQTGDTMNFGSLTFASAGDVNIAEDSTTQLSGTSSANNLVLASTAAIGNATNASLAVTGNASFAGTSIDLGNQTGDSFVFGSLTFNSAGAVDIWENSDTQLYGTSTADSLVLHSLGAITNAASASVTVTNNASFSGGSVTLGNQAGDTMSFGSLTFNSAGAVNIAEDDSTLLSGTSAAGDTLILASTAGIGNGASASLTVTNNASFNGTGIDLGNQSGDTMSFGSLTFNSAGNVNVSENGSSLLSGTSTANNLTLVSTAAITNAASASVTVTNNASFSGTSITLGDQAGDAMNFGSLDFTSAGTVNIAEDSDTNLSNTSTADALILSSAGVITNATGVSVTVDNNAALSGTDIILGNQTGDTMNFGSLTFTSAGTVNVAEDSGMQLSGTSSAGSAILATTGNLTNAASANVTVTNNASLSGANVTLGNQSGDAINFGSLTFASAGAVAVAEDSDMQLSGTSTADSLTLASTGAVTNAASASVTVTNNASLSGTGITLGDQTGDALSFGSLTFASAGAVSIAEDSATQLSGTSTAASLVLASTSDIGNASGASVTVTGNASLASTAGDIVLGNQSGDTMNFGSLTLNTTAGDVNIAEDSAMSIAGTSVVNGGLTLTGPGNIDAYGAGGSLTVTGALNVTAPGGYAWFDYYAGGGHDYQGQVNITARDSVYVLDKNDLELGVISSENATSPFVWIGAQGSITNLLGGASINAPYNSATQGGTVYLYAATGGIAQHAAPADVTHGIYFTPETKYISIYLGSTNGQAVTTFDDDAIVAEMRNGNPLWNEGETRNDSGELVLQGFDHEGNFTSHVSRAGQLYLCSLSSLTCTDGFTGEVFGTDISGILNAAAQDLFNSTFGTDNIRVAIQNGFLTEFGVVPPGIDAIDGDGVKVPVASQALVIDPPPFLIDEEELKRRLAPKQ